MVHIPLALQILVTSLCKHSYLYSTYIFSFDHGSWGKCKQVPYYRISSTDSSTFACVQLHRCVLLISALLCATYSTVANHNFHSKCTYMRYDRDNGVLRICGFHKQFPLILQQKVMLHFRIHNFGVSCHWRRSARLRWSSKRHKWSSGRSEAVCRKFLKMYAHITPVFFVPSNFVLPWKTHLNLRKFSEEAL